MIPAAPTVPPLVPVMTHPVQSSTIRDVARVAFRDYLVGQDLDTLLENVSQGDKVLLKSLREALTPYGVGVLQVGITDLAVTKVVSLFLPDSDRRKAMELA
jgi:hypothetical protein